MEGKIGSMIPPCPPGLNPTEPMLEFDRTANVFREELNLNRYDLNDGIMSIPDRPGLAASLRRWSSEAEASATGLELVRRLAQILARGCLRLLAQRSAPGAPDKPVDVPPPQRVHGVMVNTPRPHTREAP